MPFAQLSQQADAWSSGPLLTNYSYDPNGAVTGMRKVPSSGAPSLDSLVYSYRGLTEGFLYREYSGASVTRTSEWRYRYSAGGEREQKRLYLQQDSLHNVIPHNSWVYYLLGGRKEQLAVYHGQEISLPTCLPPGAAVYLYPIQYATYGTGAMANLLSKPDAANAVGRKVFHIHDHVGSTRVEIDPITSIEYFDYGPDGNALTGAKPPIEGYTGKQTDGESGLTSVGVRNKLGFRFLSIDPKFESFCSESPYSYALNNPLRLFDPNGMNPYTFYVRSFHPDATFGGGFNGNNRSYSTSTESGVTSKISQRFTLETDNEKSVFSLDGFRTWSDVTTHPLLGKGLCSPTWGYSSVERRGNTFSWWTSYAGGNPLVPLAPDIDVHSQFELTEDKRAGLISIAAKIVGDGFSSAEAFVQDSKGQSVFLGVFHYEGTVATALWGAGEKDMIKANFQIRVDKNGDFLSVEMNGKSYTVDQWNAAVSVQSK